MALLTMVGVRWLLTYLASTLGLYFVYKILRRDILYWMPLDGALGVVMMLIMRSLVFLVNDFTATLQLRAPAEMGGLAWSCQMVRARATHNLPLDFPYTP